MRAIKYYNKTLGKFVSLQALQVSDECEEALDEYGRFGFEYPATDPEIINITHLTQIQFWENGEFIYGGYITTIEPRYSSLTPTIRFAGVSYLVEFTWENTLPNILYANVSIDTILNPASNPTLIKPSTWTSEIEPHEGIDVRFSYLSSLQSTLETFQVLKQRTGYHFRYAGDSESPRKIEFGLFGKDNGVRIRKQPSSYNGIDPKLLVVLEDGVSLTESSETLVNQIYPMGGGQAGSNQISLRDVDPSIIETAYPIEIDPEIPNTDVQYETGVYTNTATAPNTYTAYFIKDAESITKFGVVIKKPVVFNDIQPIANTGDGVVSNDDRVTAANDLYKTTVNYLKENSMPQVTYSIDCVGTALLKVGDKVSLKYQGIVRKTTLRGEKSFIYADINEMFYITKVKTSWDNNLRKYNLEVSNIMKRPKTDVDAMQTLVNSVQSRNKQRQSSVSTYQNAYSGLFKSTTPSVFYFSVPKQMIYADYVDIVVSIKQSGAIPAPTGIYIKFDDVDYTLALGITDAFGDYPPITSFPSLSTNSLIKASNFLGHTTLLQPGVHKIEIGCATQEANVLINMFNSYMVSSI